MTCLSRRLVLTAAFLATASAARAESVLVSPALARGGVTFFCRIVNAGTTEIRVATEVMNSTGSVASSFLETTVLPGATGGGGVSSSLGLSSLYCRFRLVKGNKNKVRANACAYSSVDNSGPCLSTADAR